MSEKLIGNIPASLSHFLNKSDLDYRNCLASLNLFNPDRTARWDSDQKKYFAAVFYHLRGHFIDFMWYIANFSANEQSKNIIMENIQEELGLRSRLSHEMLYERFANENGVNLHEEIIGKAHYLPFAREFNHAHLKWLACHENDERISAFAAYERLDNLDYPYLVEMAKSFKTSPKAMTFFDVHAKVSHFESTLELIIPIWEKMPDKIITAFNFINTHQINMWAQLSDTLFSLNHETNTLD